MSHKYVPLSEVITNVRAELKKQFPEVKFRVYKNPGGWTGSFDVCVVSAPYQVYKDGREFNSQIEAWHYRDWQSDQYTAKGKKLIKGIDDIIGVYHWDESDAQIDYFCCSFYYSIKVGANWDKAFIKSASKAKKTKKVVKK